MLPEILDVAEEFGLTFDPKTHGKKETLCKCPFCFEDEAKPNKYYLSLNTEKQVYKCWFCGLSGGVLNFEARLSGKPQQEVKAKYFKENKEKHAAERLTADQLKMIGWYRLRRESRTAFVQNREEVIADWNRYKYNQLIELFAEFQVIARIDNQKERQQELLVYLCKRSIETQIPMAFSLLTHEYTKENRKRKLWAKEGTKVARIAWKMSFYAFDFQLEKAVLQVPFVYQLYMRKKEISKAKKMAN